MRFPDHPAFTLPLDEFHRQRRLVSSLPMVERVHWMRSVPVLSARSQMRLAVDPAVSVRVELAGHPYLLRTTQLLLAGDAHSRVRIALARNPILHPEALEVLRWDRDVYVLAALVKNPTLSGEVRSELEARPEKEIIRQVASSLLSTPEALTRLSRSNLGPALVAQNPTAPLEVLHALAQDTQFHQHLARNPSCPVDLLLAFVEDLGNFGHVYALEHPQLPLEVLLSFASHPDQAARASVARNVNLPREKVRLLAQDPSTLVRAAVVHRKDLPLDLMEDLARDEDPQVAGVAGCRFGPLLSDELWVELCHGASDSVAFQLLQSKVPVERLQLLPVRLVFSRIQEEWATGHPRREDLLALAQNWNGTWTDLQVALERL